MIATARIGQHLVHEWAEELSRKLGRPAEEICRNGLSAGDFPGSYELRIEFADRSFVQFCYAFWVVSPDKPGIAVFTEHNGYHLFPAEDTVVLHVTTDFVYPSEPMEP